MRSKLLGLAETSGTSATTATATSGSPAALGGTIHQIGARMVSEGKYILSGFDLVQAVKNWGDFGVKTKTKKGAWTSLLISFLLVGGWALPLWKMMDNSSVGMIFPFHSQLFMESHKQNSWKFHGSKHVRSPPSSLECSRILARPSRLGYIRDHLTTEWPNINKLQETEPSICAMSLLKPKPHQVFSWALLIGLKKVKLEVKGTFWSNSFPIFPPEMRISRPWNMLEILSISLYCNVQEHIHFEYLKTGDTFYPPKESSTWLQSPIFRFPSLSISIYGLSIEI